MKFLNAEGQYASKSERNNTSEPKTQTSNNSKTTSEVQKQATDYDNIIATGNNPKSNNIQPATTTKPKPSEDIKRK